MTPRELWQEAVREVRRLAAEIEAAWATVRGLLSRAWETFLDTPIETWALPALGVVAVLAVVGLIIERLEGGDPDEEDRRLLRDQREREEAQRMHEFEERLDREFDEEVEHFVTGGPPRDD